MPKLPDDMSDEAVKRRAHMTKLSREASVHKVRRPMIKEGSRGRNGKT